MTDQNSKETLYFKLPVYVTDLIIHMLTLFCWMQIATKQEINGLNPSYDYAAVYALLALSFTTAISFVGIKLHERKIKLSVVIWRAIKQTLATYGIFALCIIFVLKATPRHLIFSTCGTALVVISFWHFFFNKMVRLLRSWGHNIRRVVIIGADENAKRLCKEMGYGKAFTGYKVMGYFSSLDEQDMPEDVKRLGYIADCFDWIEKHKPDEIYCSLPPSSCSKETNRLIKICNDNFINFFFVPTMDGYPNRQMRITQFGRVAIIRLREEPLNNAWAKIFKRLFDIIISGIFLCTLYPLVLLFVWIGTSISSPGPLYFRQKRTGYNGKSFEIFKFRSMKVNADADKLQATKDDPRKTKFGDFLRRSSIDELPQFINVFKGDMSIIGPRPHMEHHTEVYSELIGNYMVRHLAKPGITGWAQISGCRGETKTVEEMKDRVEHDIWYIEHWTMLLDIEIFLKTIWQVIPGHDKQAY